MRTSIYCLVIAIILRLGFDVAAQQVEIHTDHGTVTKPKSQIEKWLKKHPDQHINTKGILA
jgi:hypothetical protein